MMPRSKWHWVVAWAAAVPTFVCAAWFADPNDWKEADTPPPPAFQAARALPFEMPVYSSMRYAVDPATLAIGSDGVVRYVVLISSPSGTVTALYEGLRCVTGEVKTYARFNDGQWASARDAQWVSVYDGTPLRHPLALAQQGLCVNASPATSVAEMVRVLKGERRAP